MNAIAKTEQVNMSLTFSPFKGAWVLKTTLPDGEKTEEVCNIKEAEAWKNMGVPNVTCDAHMNMIPAMLDIFA